MNKGFLFATSSRKIKTHVVESQITSLVWPSYSYTEGFFFKDLVRKRVRKRKVYKVKVVIQDSAVKGSHEYHVRLDKDYEMLILAAPILLLTVVTLWWPYVKLNVHCSSRK